MKKELTEYVTHLVTLMEEDKRINPYELARISYLCNQLNLLPLSKDVGKTRTVTILTRLSKVPFVPSYYTDERKLQLAFSHHINKWKDGEDDDESE